MKNWRKNLDVATNIILIGCCVLFLGILIKTYFFSKNGNPNNQKSLIGENLVINSVDWTESSNNLVLVLQKGCRFCEESVPFYQRLSKISADKKNFRTIAVLPQSSEESKKYLDEKQLFVSHISQSSLKELKISGTPTLLLVNKEGKVINQWVGKLPTFDEEKVIQQLTE